MYDKCERTYPGCRVHGPGCDLAFLIVHVYLPLLGAEPHTVYRDLILWGATMSVYRIYLRLSQGKGSGEVDRSEYPSAPSVGLTHHRVCRSPGLYTCSQIICNRCIRPAVHLLLEAAYVHLPLLGAEAGRCTAIRNLRAIGAFDKLMALLRRPRFRTGRPVRWDLRDQVDSISRIAD